MGKFMQNFILLVRCAVQGMFSLSNCNYYVLVVMQSQQHLKGNKLKKPGHWGSAQSFSKAGKSELHFLKMLFCKQAICFITHG